MAEAAAASLLCTRAGCQQRFDPDNNKEGSCVHHPGHPVFHEGLKGWSCCDKRFTDFNDFLSYPGCTRGTHTTEKQVLPEAVEELKKKEQTHFAPMNMENVRTSDALVTLEPKFTSSLTAALAKQEAKFQAEEAAQEVKPGQACTRNACKGEYRGPESDAETCQHHEGAPVFHEGMKYWSCCSKKKTHDFDEFLSMPGCSTVEGHRWFKPRDADIKAHKCRVDWIQTPTHVVITIYAKCVEPTKASFKVNADTFNVSITFETCKTFEANMHLGGKIDPANCKVEVASTKADIKLAKAQEGEQWSVLDKSA